MPLTASSIACSGSSEATRTIRRLPSLASSASISVCGGSLDRIRPCSPSPSSTCRARTATHGPSSRAIVKRCVAPTASSGAAALRFEPRRRSAPRRKPARRSTADAAASTSTSAATLVSTSSRSSFKTSTALSSASISCGVTVAAPFRMSSRRVSMACVSAAMRVWPIVADEPLIVCAARKISLSSARSSGARSRLAERSNCSSPVNIWRVHHRRERLRA